MDFAFNSERRIEPTQDFPFEEIYEREEGPPRREVSSLENALPTRLLEWQWADSYSPKKLQGLELRAAVVCWVTLPVLRNIGLTDLTAGLGKNHKQSLGRYVDDFKRHFPLLRHPSMRR